jgi:hypothetical protein
MQQPKREGSEKRLDFVFFRQRRRNGRRTTKGDKKNEQSDFSGSIPLGNSGSPWQS